MSAEVATQSRTSGQAKKANKPRGGNASGTKGPNRNARPGNSGGKGNAKGTGSQNTPAATDAPAQIAARLNEVALSDAGEDICWICAEPVKYYAVPECNHRTCHICALRLRALYKNTLCTFCKAPQTHAIFTTSPDIPYEAFTPEMAAFKDAKLSVSFETQEMMEDILILLRFNCPDSECDYIGNGWGDLRLHVRATHGKLMCDVCIRHKKVFSHEHTLYQPAMLSIHLPSMPQNRSSKSAVKETPEGGIHPLCAFCKECFFGDDELYSHMREKHEECFVCKRNEVRDQYFQNYEALERHFNNSHYACNQPECLVQKFVVFNTALDLKAHMVEVHGGDMTSRDKKDARRIQAEFAFEEVGFGGRHGRGGRDRERDRDRERERDRDPPPQQQQQPAARAAPAAGGRRQGFGGALTTDSGPAAGPSNNGVRTRPPSPQQAADIDPETAQRHSAFLVRLQTLAQNPASAVPAVKSATRSYRASESSAKDLIQIIWNVLDRNLEYTASIVNAFIDLIDDDEKKQDLLASWNGFAIEQRRQFPDLTPTSIGSGYAGIASGRVLNAKHATATRSARSQQVWNRVAQAASASAFPSIPSSSSQPPPAPSRPQERFPALGRSSPAPKPQAAAAPPAQTYRSGGGQRNTPWAGSSAASPAVRTQGIVSVSSPAASSSAARKSGARQAPPKLSSALFPDLPSASNTRSKPQVSGNVSLKNILGSTGAPPVAAWGSGSPEGSSQDADTEADASQAPKGKKGKGKQKQTLFTLGSFPT